MGDNLPELRDIYIPDGVSMWPLAYGWWVLALSIFVCVLLLQAFLFIYRRNKKRYALRLLENISSSDIISSARNISELLRRICIYKYKEAVALSGEKWIEFLNSHSKKKLEQEAADLLLNSPYVSNKQTKYSISSLRKLQDFVRQWIGDNL